jgi:hypothetical protein
MIISWKAMGIDFYFTTQESHFSRASAHIVPALSINT